MRSSDRWVTPGVIVTAIIVGGVVLLATVGAVAWLTDQGKDPDPMLRLLAQVAAALGSIGSVCLQLATRRTVAKTERNTGHLVGAVYEVADAMPRPVPRHAAPAMQSAAPADPGRE